jgi:hypothetical protein
MAEHRCYICLVYFICFDPNCTYPLLMLCEDCIDRFDNDGVTSGFIWD